MAMDKVSRHGRDRGSEPPSYSLRARVALVLPNVLVTLGLAGLSQNQGSARQLFLGFLRTLGTASTYFALVCGVQLVPVFIMWLIIKKLHLEPYQTIWHYSTTVAPRVLIHIFLWLLSIEGLSLFSLPSYGPLSFLIQQAPRLALAFKWLGIGAYATVAIWRATDATAAYFFTRRVVSLGISIWSLESFIPESMNRFFIFPLLFPIAIIVNGCMYTASPTFELAVVGLTSAIGIIGGVTLAVAAVWLYFLFSYGVYFFFLRGHQPAISKSKRSKSDSSQSSGLVTRILDELALQAFVFGLADDLQKMRERRKRRL